MVLIFIDVIEFLLLRNIGHCPVFPSDLLNVSWNNLLKPDRHTQTDRQKAQEAESQQPKPVCYESAC